MSFANKHNAVRFSFDTTGFAYVSLHDLFTQTGADTVHTARALYVNSRSKFGPAPVIATDDVFVNLPSHMVDEVREILNDGDDVAAINAGKVGFKVYTYESHGRVCYGINWVDL